MRLRQFSYFFTLLCFTLALSLPAYGIDKTNSVILQQLQKEEPDLFQRVNLVSEGERELLEVTLSDVLKMVLKRSITIEAQRLGEKAALAGLDSAHTIYQPTLTTSARQNKSASRSGSTLSGDTAATNYLTTSSTDATTLAATVSKRNSLGITFSSTLQTTKSQTKLYYMADKGDDITGGSTTDDPLDTTSLSASVSVPLFQDWGEVNDLPIRRSELSIDQSKITTHSTVISLLESVAKTYWSLVGVQQNIMTLQDAVELSERLVEETGARVEVGVLNPTDLKEAETQLAANRQSLLTKKIEEQQIEDQIRVALNLGLIPYGFKPADFPRIHGEDFDFKGLLDKAFENSTALKNYQVAYKSNQYDLEEALNQDKSDLDLSVSYSLNGYGASTSESMQSFSNSEYQGYSVGLTWKAPLFDKSIAQTIMKRKIERSMLELQINDTKSQIYVNLQTILRNLKFGIEEEKTAQLSVNLAKDLLEKEVEKLKIGKSTSFNVSQAQQKYTDAKLGDTFVRIRNETNFVSLLVLTGEIYQNYDLQDYL
jgi:outer membrane protein